MSSVIFANAVAFSSKGKLHLRKKVLRQVESP